MFCKPCAPTICSNETSHYGNRIIAGAHYGKLNCKSYFVLNEQDECIICLKEIVLQFSSCCQAPKLSRCSCRSSDCPFQTTGSFGFKGRSEERRGGTTAKEKKKKIGQMLMLLSWCSSCNAQQVSCRDPSSKVTEGKGLQGWDYAHCDTR